jgi:signal transduction histidine kinase
VDNALLRRKVQQAALVHEKERIARQLHDTVAQILFSIGLGLEWCLQHVAPETEVHAKLLDLRRLSGQGTTEIRSAIFTLASNIGQGEIVPAIRKLVADLGEKYGWQTNMVVTGTPEQPPLLVQNAIHRIVREGMINTYKHAQAGEVMVSLRFMPGQITVVVQDDGRGQASTVRAAMASQDHHFGLRTVQAQVADLGGSFDVYDADERGIVLRATIPLAGQEERETQGVSHGGQTPRDAAPHAALSGQR